MAVPEQDQTPNCGNANSLAQKKHTDRVLTVQPCRKFEIFQNKNWRGANSIKQTKGKHGSGHKPRGRGLCRHLCYVTRAQPPPLRPHKANARPVR